MIKYRAKSNPRTKFLKKIFVFTMFFWLILLFYLFQTLNYKLVYDEAELQIGQDIDEWLYEQESEITSIKPGLQKQVLWHHEDRRVTDLAFVFVHGFSASRAELSPLVENLAEYYGANVFFTRLKGHGLFHGDDFEHLSAESWFADIDEAHGIASRIGRKTIWIGASTGGTLAVWQSQRKSMDALVLISPNFGLYDKRSRLMLGPLGPWITRTFLGEERTINVVSDLHEYRWTTRYSTKAVVSMVRLVHWVKRQNAQISAPLLMLYSPFDTVVSPEAMIHWFENANAPRKELVSVEQCEDHAVAGEVFCPHTTDMVQDLIVKFLEKHL